MTVLIYSRPTCAPCGQAKRWFNDHKIAYSEVNLDENPDLEENVFALSGYQQVPVIVINNSTIISGYNRPRLEALLPN